MTPKIRVPCSSLAIPAVERTRGAFLHFPFSLQSFFHLASRSPLGKGTGGFFKSTILLSPREQSDPVPPTIHGDEMNESNNQKVLV
jgi:hypothetical protein